MQKPGAKPLLRVQVQEISKHRAKEAAANSLAGDPRQPRALKLGQKLRPRGAGHGGVGRTGLI